MKKQDKATSRWLSLLIALCFTVVTVFGALSGCSDNRKLSSSEPESSIQEPVYSIEEESSSDTEESEEEISFSSKPSVQYPVTPTRPTVTTPSSKPAPKPTSYKDRTYENRTEDNEQATYQNVTVKSGDVTLSNKTIKGDLTIHRDVGDGKVTLHNVTVEGKVNIYGGSKSRRSGIVFSDFTAKDVKVYKSEGRVRLTASGKSNIENVNMYSPVIFEESDLNGSYHGFQKVVTNKSEFYIMFVDLEQTELSSLVTNAHATYVNLSRASSIKVVTANKPTRLEGGTIEKLMVDSEDVEYDKEPDDVVILGSYYPHEIEEDDDDDDGGGGTVTPPITVTVNNAQTPSVVVTWPRVSGATNYTLTIEQGGSTTTIDPANSGIDITAKVRSLNPGTYKVTLNAIKNSVVIKTTSSTMNKAAYISNQWYLTNTPEKVPLNIANDHISASIDTLIASIPAANNTADTLFIQEGTYNGSKAVAGSFTSPLTVKGSGVVTVNGITTIGSDVIISGVTFGDVTTINGNNVTISATIFPKAVTFSGSNASVSESTFQGKVTAAGQGKFNKVTLAGGVEVTAASAEVSITNSTVTAPASGTGVDVQNGTGKLILTGNTVNGAAGTTGLKISDTTASPGRNIVVTGNTISGHNIGVEVIGNARSIQQNKIKGNTTVAKYDATGAVVTGPLDISNNFFGTGYDNAGNKPPVITAGSETINFIPFYTSESMVASSMVNTMALSSYMAFNFMESEATLSSSSEESSTFEDTESSSSVVSEEVIEESSSSSSSSSMVAGAVMEEPAS